MEFTPITKPTSGTSVKKGEFGDLVVDDLNYLYALRDMPVWVPLNGATPLVSGDKAYLRIPAKFDSGLLVKVEAHCKDPSSSGVVELAVKNGSTSMLTTNITLDQSETDTLTAASQAVIDTAHDDVAEGNFIEVSVVQAGTGVTYCGVELTFRPPVNIS